MHRRLSFEEELANAVTHGIGAALSVAGLLLLVLRAVETGDPWRVVGFSVFGATMVLLYVASTLYHVLAHTHRREALKRLDHALIYALIAATYTPFMLGPLRGPWGWSLLGAVWALAFAGIAQKALWPAAFRRGSTAMYLAMGWLGAVAARPLLSEVPHAALAWLLAGGVVYSVGTAFYVRRSLVYHHAVWHVFVLAGSACHFVAVYGYLA